MAPLVWGWDEAKACWERVAGILGTELVTEKRSLLPNPLRMHVELEGHHLLVEDRASETIVGTYRMQTSEMAARACGFYSAGEFALESLPPELVGDAVEVGRACISREHRGRQVLFLLWRGLAAYLMHFGKRYLFGCCSLSTQEEEVGLALHRQQPALLQ